MSETENKRLMENIFAAMSRGDLEPLIRAMADDMRWTWMGTDRWSHTFEGKELVVNELFAGVRETLSPSFEAVPHQFIAEGEYVVVEHSGRNTTRDGRPYHNRYCWVCRLSDGRFVPESGAGRAEYRDKRDVPLGENTEAIAERSLL
jgi:uncharacterized protein